MGFSHSTVAKYIIAVANKKSSSVDATGRFAELFVKSSHKAASDNINLYQKQEREAASLVKKQKTFTICISFYEGNDLGRVLTMLMKMTTT